MPQEINFLDDKISKNIAIGIDEENKTNKPSARKFKKEKERTLKERTLKER